MANLDELYITVLSAKNLRLDCNPYCVLKSNFNKQTYKTNVIKKTSSPHWDQSFTIFFNQNHHSSNGEIHIRVLSKEVLRGSPVGDVRLGLKTWCDGKDRDEWIGIINKGKVCGELHLKIKSKLLSRATLRGSQDPLVVLNKNYEIGQEIGRGGFSVVKKCKEIATGKQCALKIAKKGDVKYLIGKREVEVLRKIQHPNIIDLYDIYDTDEALYLVLEYANAGEIFDVIEEDGPFSEVEVAKLIKQLLGALEYMHSNGFVHRDLKPENILMSKESSGEFQVKLADFGLAKEFENGMLQTFCGTPDYVAPEILTGEVYTQAVDIWSLGETEEMLLNIINAKYNFKLPQWKKISPLGMLKLDPDERLSAGDYLKHPWIVEFSTKQDVGPRMDKEAFNTQLFSDYRQERARQRRSRFDSRVNDL